MSGMRDERRAPILTTPRFLQCFVLFLPADPSSAGVITLVYNPRSPGCREPHVRCVTGFPSAHCRGPQSDAPRLLLRALDAHTGMGRWGTWNTVGLAMRHRHALGSEDCCPPLMAAGSLRGTEGSLKLCPTSFLTFVMADSK